MVITLLLNSSTIFIFSTSEAESEATMSDEERLFERALKTSTFCLLDPLDDDIEKNPINRDDFDEFRLMLDDQLHLLLDILYQNGNLLRDQAFDSQLVQLRANLVLITCEQTEPNPFFQSDQKILLDSLVKITDDNLKHFDDAVMQKVIQTYKDGLKNNCWKKQLGMIHGFPKFCEMLLKSKPQVVDGDVMIFILSVGSNLILHFDPHYKTIGLKIYHRLMKNGDKDLIKTLNIHQVVYSESLKMIGKSNEFGFNDHVYECLLHVLFIEDPVVKTSKWCKFDDVFEKLLTQFGSESDVKVSIMLLEKIVKLCGQCYEGLNVALPDISFDRLTTHFDELTSKTMQMNFRTMRWVKNLMQMMVSESAKLLTSSNNCLKVLNSFHSIYVLTIFNLKPSILGNQLNDFTRKIILVFMQVARTFKDERPVISSIILFLKTIEQHQQENSELVRCIQKILNHEAFDKK